MIAVTENYIFFQVLTSDVTTVDGCDDFRENKNVIEIVLKGKGKQSHCKVIIDDESIDVVAYEMSVDILNAAMSSSSTSTSATSSSEYISPGLMFNVQDTERKSNDDKEILSTLSPQSYDFVFLRFVIKVN